MWDSICPKCGSYNAYVELVTDGEYGGWIGRCMDCKHAEPDHGSDKLIRDASFRPKMATFEERWPHRLPKKASQYLEE